MFSTRHCWGEGGVSERMTGLEVSQKWGAPDTPPKISPENPLKKWWVVWFFSHETTSVRRSSSWSLESPEMEVLSANSLLSIMTKIIPVFTPHQSHGLPETTFFFIPQPSKTHTSHPFPPWPDVHGSHWPQCSPQGCWMPHCHHPSVGTSHPGWKPSVLLVRLRTDHRRSDVSFCCWRVDDQHKAP